jgi:hypothetical protein
LWRVPVKCQESSHLQVGEYVKVMSFQLSIVHFSISGKVCYF